ncbi:immunoglobulin-like domain-containing protein [Radiobacillus sp. PE A8.2]|uniref:immunoglobulin-like domain-containing protein n=1 Tax=Radiobacillus sp. PE A8.2 TaxID=3380349 RepID=UPI003890DEC8
MKKQLAMLLAVFFMLSVVLTGFQPKLIRAKEDVDSQQEFLDVSDMSDDNFFGVWDDNSSEWTVNGKINYDYSDELQPVEDNVKAGDYAGAKEALLAYYQNRTEQTILPYEDWYDRYKNEAKQSELVPIIADNIFTLSGEYYITTFSVNNEDSSNTIDVTEQVLGMSGNNELAFFLMARKNEPSTAQFHSKESNSNQPVLEVKVNGTTHTLLPTDDTYIQPGSNINTVFGNESVLEVRDEGPGAFTDETRKAYLKFNLSELSGTPTQAELKLSGKNISGTGEKEIMLYTTDNVTFDEDTQTWNNILQNTYSWAGVPGGTDWKNPKGADRQFGSQIPRFYFAMPLAYKYYQDKDESAANDLIELMMDFIQDTDSYNAPENLGAGSYSNTLGAAKRVQMWIKSYHLIRNSASMKAPANTAILKTLFKSGEHLKRQDHKSWDTSINSALYRLAVYFPEFVNSEAWFNRASSKLREIIEASFLSDGGFYQSSTSYGIYFAEEHVRNKQFGSLNGRTLDLGDKPMEEFLHYFMNVALPDGVDANFGDSAGLSIRDRLYKMGKELNDPALTYVGSSGEKGSVPAHTSVLYPQERSAIMRSGWSEDSLYARLSVDNGPHEHPDENDLTVYGYGRQLLPGMGSFNYSNDSISSWLRNSTEAHNTIEIDDRKQNSNRTGSMNGVSNDQFDFVVGTTEATSDFSYKRATLFIKPGYWIVSDYIDAPSGSHKYEQNWHFLPDANIAIDSDMKTSKSHFADGANIQVVPADPDEITATLEDGYYSSEFYMLSDAKYTSYVKNTAGDVTFDTILYPTEEQDNRDVKVTRLEMAPNVQTTTATALKIDLDNDTGDNGYYYLSHENTPEQRTFGGYQFDGEMAYVEAAGDAIGSALIHNGKTLKADEKNLLKSPNEIKEVAVKWDGDTVNIDGSGLEVNQSQNSAIAIYAPEATNVTFNGEAVEYTRNGDYIYAVGAPFQAVVADTYVQGGDFGNQNFGSEPTMLLKNAGLVSYDRSPLMKIDTSSLDPNIESAKLFLYGSYQAGEGSLTAKVYSLGDDWEEENVTWNNAPDVQQELTTIQIGQEQKWYEIDLTEYIQQEAEGDQAASIIIRAETPEMVIFDSKESSHAPYLDVKYTEEDPTDEEKPVITLNGENPMTVEVNESYEEPGAMATDNNDGDLTGDIAVSGEVDTSALGTYEVTYTVTDSSGNTETVKRTVKVVDTTDPVIELNGSNSMTVEVNETYEEPGAMATDNNYGDLTEDIDISGEVDTSTVGTYEITYTVTDSSDNTMTVKRTVEVVDTTDPVIELTGENPLTLRIGEEYEEPGAEVTDNSGEDLTNEINISGDVDTNAIGTYTVSYTVTDSSGNVGETTRTVKIVDDNMISFGEERKVRKGEKFIIEGTTSSIIMPDDLPLGTTIMIEKVEGDANGNLKLAGDVYEVTVVYPDGATPPQNDFTLTLSYAADADSNAVNIYYFDEETNEWVLEGGQVNTENKKITLHVPHFSKYGVFQEVSSDDATEDPDENETPNAEDDKEELPNTSTITFNLLLLGMIMLLVGSVMVARRQ